MKLRTVLLLAAVVLVALVAATLLLGPSTPAAKPIPVPNGYDDFIAAGKLIAARTPDWQTLDLPALRTLVASNAPALALVRTGLTKQCLVPPAGSRTNMDAYLERLAGFKRTALAFSAETRVAATDGRTNAAALAALDCIRFGQETVRGGPIIDHLVGVAIRALGFARLQPLLPALDAPTLKRATADLEHVWTTRETIAEVEANEARWVRANFPLAQRTAYKFVSFFQPSLARNPLAKLDPSYQQVAHTMLDCAARAYEQETGSPPAGVTNLGPRYLKAVPVEPATGRPMALPGQR